MLLAIFICSPLIYTLLVGIPVRKAPQQNSYIVSSKRCFEVGNTKAYIRCLANPKIAGTSLIEKVTRELDEQQPIFGIVFIGVTLLLLVFIFLVSK